MEEDRCIKFEEVPEYVLKFNPLWSFSKKKQADVDQVKANTELAKAQTAQAYVDMQALDASEVRKRLAANGEFTVNNILNEEQEDSADIQVTAPAGCGVIVVKDGMNLTGRRKDNGQIFQQGIVHRRYSSAQSISEIHYALMQKWRMRDLNLLTRYWNTNCSCRSDCLSKHSHSITQQLLEIMLTSQDASGNITVDGGPGSGRKPEGGSNTKSSKRKKGLKISPKEREKVTHDINNVFHKRFEGKPNGMIITHSNKKNSPAYNYYFENNGFGKYNIFLKTKNLD